MAFIACAIAIVGCVSPLEPCVPQLGTGCFYYIPMRDDVTGELLVTLQSAPYTPCLPKSESDRRFPGWQVAPDTIKSCPPPRRSLAALKSFRVTPFARRPYGASHG